MLKNSWAFAAACAWLFAGATPLSAASAPHCTIDGWDTEKGLPQMSVIALTQTRDGYLWLGTGDGLARFDGVRFKRFEEEEALQLSGSKIVRLFEDRRGNLWIGTDTAGVVLVAPDGKVTNVALDEAASEGPLVGICEDQVGGIWLRLAHGHLYWYVQGKAHVVANGCRGLLAEDSGLVWVGSSDGRLIGLGPISNSIPPAVFPVSYEVPVGKLDFLLASKRGGYWRLANGRIQRWKVDSLQRDFGAYPWNVGVPVLSACEDQDGNLVVGTYGDGVYWMDSAGKFPRVEGLTNRFIYSLLIDREGSLWVGSDGGGLSRARPQSFDVVEGTRGSTVQSACEDPLGGFWIGYNSERIDHWNGNSFQTFTNLWPTELYASPGLTRFYARTVFEDRSHQVWAGGTSEITTHPPLLRLEGGRFRPAPGAAALDQEVLAAYEDSGGVLWLGTPEGLARWDGRAWKLFTTRDGLSSDRVRCIAEDTKGNLWVGTERGGLNCLRDGKFSVFRQRPKDGLPSDSVSSLYVDQEGVVWIGTWSGLVRYDQGQWTCYTTREGLLRNKIGYIVEDGLGFLWIGSKAGLMRISKRSLNEFSHNRTPGASIPCRFFSKSDGLPTSECSDGSQPGALRARDGTLCFPTIGGLVIVNPAKLLPNTNPPPVVIEAVRIDGELQQKETLRSPPPQTVTVPAGKESLEIVYASLNLSAPDKGFFKYIVEPYETTWTERPGSIRSARYPKLPHGHYRFHVQACNEDGVWNETGATLAITVLPAFYQTWWFLTSAGLCLLGMIVGSVHYVSTQKLQRQVAALRQQEALEKERARIARDLHDQLGANLTQVALLGEMAETDKNLPAEIETHARQISNTARETTHALDEIVWTVNPSNDTLDGLINYVCKYAQEYLALAGLRYRLEVPAQLPSVPISPELRHNVFLAAKEAVNNVVKHSKATSAWLRLRLEPERFLLEIEDNGCGLGPDAGNKGRNGLRNMRKRMEDVGGSFETGPGAEGGTRVCLSAPFKQDSSQPGRT
ncbi:MAG TPA: two-component regulator propeller domain-containing protein [Candidatus Acidoferrum sp.]|jgi:ligand-binding sensor domain-containing protein/signal transduction histidine kinase|nr:two-component regulator propeller domain-containing protein [Candidatus Acidoferrum sp.]